MRGSWLGLIGCNWNLYCTVDDSLRTHLKIMSLQLRSFNHFCDENVKSGTSERVGGGEGKVGKCWKFSHCSRPPPTRQYSKCKMSFIDFFCLSVDASRSTRFQTGSGKLEITLFSGHYLVVDKHLTDGLHSTPAQAGPYTGWKLKRPL